MQNTVHKKSWDSESGNSGKRNKRKREVALWEMEAPYSTRTLQVLEMNNKTRYQNDNIERINQRRQARRRRAYFYRALAFVTLISCVALIFLVMGFIFKFVNKEKTQTHETIPVIKRQVINKVDEVKIEKPEMMVDLLEVNDYSRPATEIEEIKSVFVHYTANPGTSAKQNRSYFSNLGETHERSASAHFIIGYEGEIIQCIPLDEQAYAVMTRNNDSISIECCYLDEDGQFTQETYDSLIHLLAWLKQEYNLENEDILRHYDCGGKLCPLYYVENEDAWDKLIRDVERYQD